MDKHKHHITPKHAGGTDDPTNIVELTVEEHADAHRVLFEMYGRWQDYIAWQGLSGRLNKEDIIREKIRLGNIGKKPWHKGKIIGPRTDETKKRISDTMRAKGIKPSAETLKKAQLAAQRANRGKKLSTEERLVRSNCLKEWNKNNPRPFRPRAADTKAKIAAKLCKKCLYNNTEYNSLKQCKEHTGLTRYSIVNDPSFAWT